MTPPVPIVIKPLGPIVIEGPIDLRDHEGHPIPIPPNKTPGIVKLCGCGRSQKRPFCDGAHKIPAAPPAAD